MQPFLGRVSDDYSPKTVEDFIAFFERAADQQKTWAVYRNGELGGMISYQQVSPIVGTAHCVFKKTFWGHATTMEALRQAFLHMFENCTKISSPVMEGNKAMLSLLMKMGAKREGVLEAHTLRDGKPLNLVMTAFFRDSFTQKFATKEAA